MSRPLHRVAVAAILTTFAAAILAVGGMAKVSRPPFFVVPPGKTPATTECRNLAYCYGVRGPWVIVPPTGEATFLLACPEQAKALGAYLLGGTDALTSSDHVHVWYDGQLGAPIGAQTTKSSSAGLLFHAVTDNAQAGSFQPILGCISLAQASRLSTVSETRPVAPLPGSPAASPPKLRATLVVLEPGWDRPINMSCQSGEKLVGNWSAVAFGTQGPPIALRAGAVKIATADVGRTVQARVRTSTSVPYLIRIQIGAMCES